MKDWLQRKWAAARSQLKAPSVAVDTVSVTQGHLRAHITGEPVPRHFEQVHMSLRLGRNYKSLAIDLQGTAFACVPGIDICSLLCLPGCHVTRRQDAFYACKPEDAIADVGKVMMSPCASDTGVHGRFGQATKYDAVLPACLQLRCMSGTPPRTSAP